MSASTRVVITGCGAVCGAGRSLESIWNKIIAGQSAVGPISQWETDRWPVQIAAEVQDVRGLVDDRRLQKMISRTDLFGLYAAAEAIRQSGVLAQREKLDAARE